MLWLCQIAPLKDGDAPAPPDASTAGWLRVIHKGETKWARPCFPPGMFQAPTEHWIRKNGPRWRVWVAPELSPIGEQLEDSLIYTGFLPVKGGLQDDIDGGFPTKRLHFSDRWELVVDDTPADPSVTLRYVGDPENDASPPAAPGAVTVKFSQKPGDESIFVDHIVNGTPIGTNVLVDKDGTVTVNVKKDANTTVEMNTTTQVNGAVSTTVNGTTSLHGKGKVTVTLDDELAATIAKKVALTLQDELTADVTKKVTATIVEELSVTVANVSKLFLSSSKAELQAATTAKATLEAAGFKVELGAASLEVTGAAAAATATVGTGADNAVAYTPFDLLWTQLFTSVLSLVATHTHDVVFGACTAGGTTGTAPTAPSSAIASIGVPLPTASVKSSFLKMPLG